MKIRQNTENRTKNTEVKRQQKTNDMQLEHGADINVTPSGIEGDNKITCYSIHF